MTIMSSRRYWRSSTNSGATPEDNTDSLEDVLAADDDPDLTQERYVRPTRMGYPASVGLGARLNSARSRSKFPI